MKTSIFIGFCVIFITTLVQASDDDEGTVGPISGLPVVPDLGCAAKEWTAMAAEKSKEIVCGEQTAKELAEKYNLQLPQGASWRVVESWFRSIKMFLINMKMIECSESSTSTSTATSDQAHDEHWQ